MIQHFKFKPLFENTQLPGWAISFYYKQIKYNADYLKDGQIKFGNTIPPEEDRATIEKMVHELMLFHVYD